MTTLRDRGLNTAFKPMESRLDQGGRLKKADINALIDTTADGPGVSKTETKDLQKVLDKFGTNMTPAARRTLEDFLTTQSQPAPTNTLSGLQLRIQTAGLRNELSGARGNPSMIEDRTIDNGEARRLVALIRKNGIVSKTEKKDITAVLDNPNLTIAPAERQILEQAIGRFVEPKSDATISGAQVQSAHVDPNATYRTESFPLALMSQAGVPQSVLDILGRADTLTGSGNATGKVSLDELVNLETNGALLPAETAALEKAFALFEVGDVDQPRTAGVQELKVTDTSVRPETLNLNDTEVSVADLPPGLQQVAQRARLVAQGAGADLSNVTLADLEHATTQDLGQTTPADRATMSGALTDAMKPLATHAARSSQFRSSAEIPDLKTQTFKMIREGALKVDLEATTTLTGFHTQRGTWSTMVRSHSDRFGQDRYPSSIPKSSQTNFSLENHLAFNVDIPPGHKLVLINANGSDRNNAVLGPGTHDAIGAGDYRALLMKDGEILEEGALRVPRESKKDASDIIGFDITTQSGDNVGFQKTGSGPGYVEKFSASTKTPNAFTGGNATTLEPGRYESTIKTGYNSPKDFILDVIGPKVMEVEIDGVRARLFPVSHDANRYEGHLDDSGTGHQVVRLDIRGNNLTVINEGMNTYHGSSGWYAEVKSRAQTSVAIGDEMLTG